MFGKGKKQKTAKIETWVGRHTRVQGDIHFIGGLHIEGHVHGNVTADNDGASVLEVSGNGSIEGQVNVPIVILNGQVSGDVHASERMELAANASVQGSVYYHMIEMAMGAEVNGKLVHTAEGAEMGATVAQEPATAKLQAVE